MEKNAYSRKEILGFFEGIQNKKGYIDEYDIKKGQEKFSLSKSDIIGILTFYKYFKLGAPGKNHIKVCKGTACHVNGADLLIQTIKEELDIEVGEKSQDGLFSLEEVACLGCCSLAPVVVINEKIYGGMTQNKLRALLRSLKKQEGI